MPKPLVYTFIAVICILVMAACSTTKQSANTSAQATVAPSAPTTVSSSWQTQMEAERAATIAALIKDARRYISQNKYPEALATIDQITAVDPTNNYATGVRPLIEERALTQEQRVYRQQYQRNLSKQLNRGQEQQIPHDSIYRYPTNWPAISDDRDRLFMEEQSVGEADHATRIALGKKQPLVRFNGTALDEVIELLRDTSGVQIIPDWEQIERAGIGRKAAIQTRLRDVTLAGVLDEVLRQVSTDPKNPLTYTVDEGVVTITTVADAKNTKRNRLVTRAGEELWIIGRVAAGETQPGDDSPGSGQLAVKELKDGKEQLIPVPLKHTDVKASIAAYISSTTVRQQFYNPYAEKIEAVYVFPLPENAAINEFIMAVGQRKIRGIIREREEAKQLYQEARAQGHVASLLTQERPNVFTQSVANIEPSKQIDIEITYYHTLAYADGWYEWAFPMVVGPRYNPAGSTQGVGAAPRGGKPGITGQATEVQYLKPGERSGHDIGLSVEVNCPAGLEEIRCASHQVNIERPSAGRAIVSIAPSDTLPNKDFVLRYRVAGGQIKSGMLVHRDQKGSYFNLMVYPPMDLRPQDRIPLEMVFLLDVSGSMSGDPINQCKAAMRCALSHMDPHDTFQVITFSGNNRALFDRAQPVTKEATDRAMHFVEDTNAGRGTEMMPAILAALTAPQDEEHKRVVVFLTDGFVGNEDDILRAVHDRLGPARIFSFGVGSSPNRYLMDGLARIGRGAVAYLGLRDSGEDVMRLYFDRVAAPAMTDIAFDFGENMKPSELYPAKKSDLFVGRPIIVAGCFSGELPRQVQVHGRIGGRAVTISVPVDTKCTTNPALAAIWARQKITDLSDEMFMTPNRAQELVLLVKQTALDHGLMSQYTAFIAVDSSQRTVGDHGISVAVPVVMPEGVKYETTVPEK